LFSQKKEEIVTKSKKKASTVKKHTAKKTPATSKTPLVTAEPQFKQQAAIQSGMFLYTNDSWSNAYFNDNDLHNLERKLFG
jgi:hypothetical protein